MRAGPAEIIEHPSTIKLDMAASPEMIYKTSNQKHYKGFRLKRHYSQKKLEEREFCKSRTNLINPQMKDCPEFYQTHYNAEYHGHKS